MRDVLADSVNAVRFLIAIRLVKNQMECIKCPNGSMTVIAVNRTKYESGVDYRCVVCENYSCLSKGACCFWPKGLSPETVAKIYTSAYLMRANAAIVREQLLFNDGIVLTQQTIQKMYANHMHKIARIIQLQDEMGPTFTNEDVQIDETMCTPRSRSWYRNP